MPRAIIKGKFKYIPFNAKYIAFMVNRGTTVLPDLDTPQAEAEDQNNQVIEALQKLRNNLSKHLSKRKAYVVGGLADGGLVDPVSKFQTDSDGAIRFDDYSDIGRANVQASGVGNMTPPQPPAVTQPSVPVAPIQRQSTNMSTAPTGTQLKTDSDGAIRFDDFSTIGQANTRAAGVGSMLQPQPSTITKTDPAMSSTQITPPVGSRLPVAGVAGNQSLPRPDTITPQVAPGTRFQNDSSGSIRFDDHSAIGLSNLQAAGIVDITHTPQPTVTQPGSISTSRFSNRLRGIANLSNSSFSNRLRKL